MKSVTPTDDKQLWRICDVIDGADYSWPLYATPCVDAGGTKFMLVELAYPLTSTDQQSFVYKRLEQVAVDTEGSKWLVRPKRMEAVAIKCQGITPKFYLKWPGEFEGGKVTEVADKSPIPSDTCPDEDFVRYAANLLGEMDVALIRLVFNTICFNAVRWFQDKRLPLKLGFCTLYALPYRKNWAGILHARYPNIASVMERDEQTCDATLDAIGFNSSLRSSDMVSMPENNIFGWTIEAVITDKAEEDFREMEREMAKKYARTAVSYAWRWANIVRDMEKEIVHVFKKWVTAAAHPVGTVDDSRTSDKWVLLPKRLRGRVRPIVPPPPPTYYRTASHAADGHPVTHPILDAAAVKGVQELPDDDELNIGIGVRKRRRVADGDANSGDGI